MGVVANITKDKFPQQSTDLLKRVKVCYRFDTSNIDYGRIIRDDIEEPFVTIIELSTNGGRVLLATECQYSFLD